MKYSSMHLYNGTGKLEADWIYDTQKIVEMIYQKMSDDRAEFGPFPILRLGSWFGLPYHQFDGSHQEHLEHLFYTFLQTAK